MELHKISMLKYKDIFAHSGFIRYLKNSSWLFLEKIFRLIVGLSVGIWIARYLGPDQFGLLNYAQSFASFFIVIAGLGLDGIVVRELVRGKFSQNKLLGTVFYLKLLGGVAVLLLLTGVFFFTLDDNYTNILIFIIASSVIFQSFNVIDLDFQAKVLSKYVAYSNIISLFVSSLVKITLILNESELIYFVWVTLFESVILALGLIFFFLKKEKYKAQGLYFSKSLAKELLKNSWPLIFSGIVIIVYMKIDQIMLKHMIGNIAVGQYAAAIRLSELWYIVPAILANSLFPAILNAKNKSVDLYYMRLQKLYDFVIWMAIIIALFVFFLSDWLIMMLYGEAYQEAANVLRVHIWAGVFVFFGIVSNKWILSENLQKYRLHIDIFGAILNVLLNIVFIPLYGIVGAALATLISYSMSTLIIFFSVKKLRIGLKMFLNGIIAPYLYFRN